MSKILSRSYTAVLLLVPAFASAAGVSVDELQYPESLAQCLEVGDAPASELQTLDAQVTPASADCGCSDECCDVADGCCGQATDCCGSSIADVLCAPTWTVDAGAVILHRSRPTARALVVPLAGPGVISNGSDFGFDWAAGPDVRIARRFESGNSLEMRYFGALDWDASALYGAVGNVRIGSFSNFGATDLRASYSSSLHSTELNWLRPSSERVTWLAGFRWIELHEVLDYRIQFPAFSANYYWNTDNHLYGGQFGGKFKLWRLSGPLSVDASLKGGVYGNDASNAFNLLPSTGGSFPGGSDDSDVAFVGDVNLTGTYELTRHVGLYGGYQLLWVDGVALGSEQLATSTAVSSQTVINTSGDVFYHGATTGLEIVW
jgi:hypothetical protein